MFFFFFKLKTAYELRISDWSSDVCSSVLLALSGSIGWYRACEAREWSSPDPVPLFDLFMRNGEALGNAGRARGPWRWLNRAIHSLNRNDRRGAKRNIHAHYDLGNDFYRLWLDHAMNYSSALFADPRQSLEDAQAAKVDAILDRLDLRSGSRLLGIGCGWGAPAERAVEQIGRAAGREKVWQDGSIPVGAGPLK